MANYIIAGALKETAEDISITVSASSTEEALKKANQMGILTSSVSLAQARKQPYRLNIRKTKEERVQTYETDYFGAGKLWVLWIFACIPCMNFIALVISAQVFVATKSNMIKKQAAQVFGLALFTTIILIVVGSLQEKPKSKPKSNTSSNYSSSYSNRSFTKQWYEGGSLHSVQVPTWRSGTYTNKLATSADWCASVDSTVSFETLKDRAIQVLYCVDEAVSGGDADHMQISEIATGCIIILRENW